MAQALQAPLSKKHIPRAPEASLQNQKMWVAKEVKSTNHNTSQHSEPILVVSICFHFVNWIQLAQTLGGQHRAERRTQSRPLGWSLAIYRKSSWCTSCHTPDSDHCQAGQRIWTWQKKHRSGSFFFRSWSRDKRELHDMLRRLDSSLYSTNASRGIWDSLSKPRLIMCVLSAASARRHLLIFRRRQDCVGWAASSWLLHLRSKNFVGACVGVFFDMCIRVGYLPHGVGRCTHCVGTPS